MDALNLILLIVNIGIGILLAYFQTYSAKRGEMQAISDNIIALQNELKENTQIVENIKHEYSKILANHMKEIELLVWKSKLMGNDEYTLTKNLALNIGKIEKEFPMLRIFKINKPIEKILNELKIGFSSEQIKSMTYYDISFYTKLYEMIQIDESINYIEIYCIDIELFWSTTDLIEVRKLIDFINKYRTYLTGYRMFGNMLLENKNDQSTQKHFTEYSLKAFNAGDEIENEFFEIITNCKKLLQNKIKNLSIPKNI